MKKIFSMIIVLVFAATVTAFAGGGAQCATSAGHRPASKSIKSGTFQGAADHIGCWGKSRAAAKAMSLRGNKEARKKRNCVKQW